MKIILKTIYTIFLGISGIIFLMIAVMFIYEWVNPKPTDLEIIEEDWKIDFPDSCDEEYRNYISSGMTDGTRYFVYTIDSQEAEQFIEELNFKIEKNELAEKHLKETIKIDKSEYIPNLEEEYYIRVLLKKSTTNNDISNDLSKLQEYPNRLFILYTTKENKLYILWERV